MPSYGDNNLVLPLSLSLSLSLLSCSSRNILYLSWYIATVCLLFLLFELRTCISFIPRVRDYLQDCGLRSYISSPQTNSSFGMSLVTTFFLKHYHRVESSLPRIGHCVLPRVLSIAPIVHGHGTPSILKHGFQVNYFTYLQTS